MTVTIRSLLAAAVCMLLAISLALSLTQLWKVARDPGAR
jgi:hypothetical protein